MGIKLTTEVKEVIHQMIAITKEFELGMMNTLVLFESAFCHFNGSIFEL